MTTTYLLDIETDSLNPSLIYCVVLKEIIQTPGSNQVNFGKHEVFTYQGLLGHPSLNDFRIRFKNDTTTMFVGHNLIDYDVPVINRLLKMNIRLDQMGDTMIMSQLESNKREGGHSLRNWGNILNYPKDDFSDFSSGLTEEMLLYCKNDVDLTGKVWMALQNKDIPQNVLVTEYRVRDIISRQKRSGFCLNIPLVMEFSATVSDKIHKIEEEFQKIFEPTIIHLKTKTKVIPFNPGSRQQIADRLIKQYGWEPEKFTETGKPMVNETILSEINSPESLKLVDYLILQKRRAQVNSWIEAADSDNLVHGSVYPLGTITGRMTHSKPNMAQVPSTRAPYGLLCREVWVPREPEYILLGCDAKSLELRCLAHYMGDTDFSQEVIHGDIHTFNQNKAGLETRDQAKTFIYALIYGAGSKKIGSIVGGTGADGQKLIDNFMSSLPKFGLLKEKVDRAAARKYIKGIDGRKIPVNFPHTALNYLLQSAGAVICKHWLIQMDDLVVQDNIRAFPVVNVHDEMQWEVLDKQAEQLKEVACKAIKSVKDILKFRCELDCDVKTGKNWAETH
jgi:DNA polymerase I-like protein with 3'-5' exonuclease and polymerase domains|tara:strand:+ start:3163 stop:4848 length:1686 start_codon:yes stop_codon:yes gene_type:complete